MEASQDLRDGANPDQLTMAQAAAAASASSTYGVKLDFAKFGQKAKTVQSVLKPVEFSEDIRGRLVSVLHAEALEHSERELKKAWDELDRLYQSADMSGEDAKVAFGPGYSPFAKQEELFFIRNQVNNAVLKESLLELRRSLAHATTFGIDMKSMEIEVAYRDALARHQMDEGFSSRSIAQALERGDWWTALDEIIGASFARGADRHVLVNLIAKVCSPTLTFPPSLSIADRDDEPLTERPWKGPPLRSIDEDEEAGEFSQPLGLPGTLAEPLPNGTSKKRFDLQRQIANVFGGSREGSVASSMTGTSI